MESFWKLGLFGPSEDEAVVAANIDRASSAAVYFQGDLRT